MTHPQKPRLYRDLIDSLVQSCKQGQGQVGPRRVRNGLWNSNATPTRFPDQHAINLLLQRLTPADRETLANMLSHATTTGVFETLKALEQFQIEPFQDGYEGSPYNDFIGRLDDWPWPES